MPALKPWYKVVDPREDLRKGKPLDASEFAVHLDKVRDGTAPEDYQDAERFFDRTYLTKNLLGFGAEVVRRLSGIKTETSAVFNMATQFGGGKTHALTLLYHLGKQREQGRGVERRSRLDAQGAGVQPSRRPRSPRSWGRSSTRSPAAAARTARRFARRPGARSHGSWGKRRPSLSVAEHEKTHTAPAGDVIRQFLPKGQAVPDPHGRAAELRQPQPQERPGHAALQLPPEPLRDSAGGGQRGARRVDPHSETWR